MSINTAELKQIIDDAPQNIRSQFRVKRYDKGNIILFPHNENNSLYIITQGTAEVYRQGEQGNILSLSLFHDYSMFGELEVFNNLINTASVVARTKVTTLIVVKDVLMQWMQSDPRLSLHIIRQLGEKLLNNTSSLEKLSMLNIEDRIICSIYNHYKMKDLEKLTKDRLSVEVCAPRRSINRSIIACIEKGYIAYSDKQFTIPNEKEFIKYAEDLIYD